jgi:hypothetical protein
VLQWRFWDMWHPYVEFCEGGEVTPPPIPSPPPHPPILPPLPPPPTRLHHTHKSSTVSPPPPLCVCGVGPAVLPCSVARWQKFRPKSSQGATEKKFVAEFWLPKTGRKGAAENFQKSSLFLAVITTYNVHQDKIKFDF